MPRRGLTAIGIASGKLHPRRKIEEEGLQQFLVRRRAKADRVGDALADGRSFVRHAGRQVQHVAGLQYDFVSRPEVGQQLQWCPLDGPQIALTTDAPAPPSIGLQQEDIVGVDVRADTAAVRGVTDHQVVEPRIGDETEPLQQRVRPVVREVDPWTRTVQPARCGDGRRSSGPGCNCHMPWLCQISRASASV